MELGIGMVLVSNTLKRHLRFSILACGFLLLVLFVTSSPGTQPYARKTGKGCIFCHQESTGGQLKTTGFAYIRNGYAYPIPERILIKAESFQTSVQKTLRFIIGYIHLLAAVVFFGAIFYIHLFVGPKKLRGGIPKAERILGLSCMFTLAVTGIYLTWVRIDRWDQFFNNTFGLMLFAKIMLFLIMVSVGFTAVTVIHRRMQKEVREPLSGSSAGEITPDDLGRFDGSGGRPAYIVVNRRAYDVSDSPKWRDGKHFGKHIAGSDLTKDLVGAPHGEEVLEKVKDIGEISGAKEPREGMPFAHKVFIRMAYINLVLIFLILACISVWRWDFPLRLLPEKRTEALTNTTCLECHRERNPGILADWKNSVHARVGVGCNDCHKAGKNSALVRKDHLTHDAHPVSVVVTPQTCSGCHPDQAAQYARSKHAHTHEIMWKVDAWLKDGMNNDVERTTGCYACHGTVVELRGGRPVPGTWPNVGVGRVNPDGSLGSCSSCHTRHRFSVKEARKPEACDQCHLGPDHPQIEIYNESKHGTIYHAEGDTWNWATDDGQWKVGRDFRAPTCAVCHMSAVGDISETHDVTRRLSWELQTPLTVRPSAFKPFPAGTRWEEERSRMKEVCNQCHSETWTNDHFSNLDAVVHQYNEIYFKPIEKEIERLYGAGLLSKDMMFDEELEWEFYELWHHEGRRARMGAAMMAPDYAWWHGFYEVKHRFNAILMKADALREKGRREVYSRFPGRYEEK